jgi:Protein of unknown function (DUF3592)
MNKFVAWRNEDERRKLSSILLNYFFLMIGGMTFIFFTFGGPEMLELSFISNWKHIKAVVISSKIQTESSKIGSSYLPIVSYSYNLNGINYLGRTRNVEAIIFRDNSEASEFISKFQISSGILVRYNPGNPSQSCQNCVINPQNLDVMRRFVFSISAVALIAILGYALISKSGKP